MNGHAIAYRELLDHPETLPSRASLGLAEDTFAFSYFGPAHKIDPTIFGIWMSILDRVPNSILWLCNLSELAICQIRRETHNFHIHESRVLFTQRVSRRESVHRNALVDLVLDTPCCNSLDDTLDALWAGTPVVTLLGRTIATRVSASMCTAVGCADLVTTSLHEYEELAVSLAIDSKKYWALRQRLDEARRDRKRGFLFDFERHVSNLEAGVEAVWATAISHKLPTNISVSPDLSVSCR